MSKLFIEAGVIALTAFISPFREDRKRVRELVEEGEFIEVYCRCPIQVCEKRDVKGLYQRAHAGKISDFTGISSPYEEPESPELIVDTGIKRLEECVEEVMNYLAAHNIVSLEKNKKMATV